MISSDKKSISVLETIIAILRKVSNTNPHDLSASTEIKYCGIDSLRFVKVVIEIEEAFSLELGDDDLNIRQYATVGIFAERIASLLDKSGKESKAI